MTKTKTVCKPHNTQIKRGEQPTYLPWRGGRDGVRSPCAFDGCDRMSRSATDPLCEGHYYQRRRGKELTALRARRADGDTTPCVVDDCEKARTGGGDYCPMHRARLVRHGDLDTAIHQRDRNLPRGADHPMWNPEGSYDAVHQRLARQYGLAKNQQCAFSCGNSGVQWAYVGTRNPDERKPWGDVSLYVPLCVRCHKAFDLSWMTTAT